MDHRQKLIYKARLCENAERYHDMVEIMKEVCSMDVEITDDERNLMSIAFKNVAGSHRSAWRLLSEVENKTKEDEERLEIIQEFKKKIESELHQICQETIDLISENLIPKSSDVECSVFHLKMIADYYRYMAETKSGAEREEIAVKAQKAYNEAYEKAKELAPTHPIRLGLVLNYSVFHYEIKSSPHEACVLAKAAFDEAIPELDSIPDEKGRDATIILQLLRDNLTLWNANYNQGEENDD